MTGSSGAVPLLLLLILLVTSTADAQARRAILATASSDVNALDQLAIELRNQNASLPAGWLPGTDPCGAPSCSSQPQPGHASCAWEGVCCSARRVVRLNVACNAWCKKAWSGPFPAPLALLTSLEYLNVSGHKLEGRIPEATLQALPSLMVLDASRNLLSGSLPNALFGQNLVFLSLSDNDFSGILPSGWQQLDSLRTLHLANNALSGQVPPSWIQMNNLAVLDITKNCGICGPNPLGPLVTVMRSGTYLGSFCSTNLCAAKRPVVPLIAALGIVGGAVSLIALLWASRAHIAACSPCLAEWLDHFLPPARPRLGEVQWAEAVQAAQAAQARMSAALRPLPLLRLTVWAGSGEVCLEKLHDSLRASLEHPYQAAQTVPSTQLGSTYGNSRLAQQQPPHPPPQAATLPPPPLTPAAGTQAAADLADLATTSTARAAPSASSSSSSSSSNCLGSDKRRMPGSEGAPAEGVAVGGEGPVPGTPVPPLVWGEEAGKDTAEVGGSTPVQGLVYQEAQWEFKLPGVDALVLSPGLRALHLARAEAPHHSGFATWSVSPPAPHTHSDHPPAQPLPDPPPPARRPLFAQLAVWTSTSRPASNPETAPPASRRSASLPPLADQPGDSRV